MVEAETAKQDSRVRHIHRRWSEMQQEIKQRNQLITMQCRLRPETLPISCLLCRHADSEDRWAVHIVGPSQDPSTDHHLASPLTSFSNSPQTPLSLVCSPPDTPAIRLTVHMPLHFMCGW
jgi:hypothetical protein